MATARAGRGSGGSADRTRRDWRRCRGRGGPRPAPPGSDAHPPPSPVTPGGGRLVPPAAVAEVDYGSPVRPSTALAGAPGALEPDRDGELWPVDRLEETVLAPDRHGAARRLDRKRERRTARTGHTGVAGRPATAARFPTPPSRGDSLDPIEPHPRSVDRPPSDHQRMAPTVLRPARIPEWSDRSGSPAAPRQHFFGPVILESSRVRT